MKYTHMLVTGCTALGVAATALEPGYAQSSSSMRKPPQTSTSSKQRKIFNDLMPEMLAYLRCEAPVRRDQFGQAAKPRLLADRLPLWAYTRSESGELKLALEVWPGNVAHIEVDAGYGFFAVTQHYPAGSAPALLTSMQKAGWEMKRSTLAQQNDMSAKLPGASAIAVHVGTAPDGDLRRKLVLYEARMQFSAGEDLNSHGVTVVCAYTEANA